MRTSRLVRGLPALVALLVFVPTSGCVTLGRYETLEQRVVELERDRSALRADLKRGFVQLENLNGMLKEAEETLRRRGSNLGIRMEAVEGELPHIRGQVEAATFQVQSARQEVQVIKREVFDRLGATVLYLPDDLPKTPDEVWERAESERKGGDRRVAQAIYDFFNASYPDHAHADDAIERLAQQAESEGDSALAIRHYKRIHKEYAEGDRAADALWKIGSLLTSRGDCEKAIGIYRYISRNTEDEERKKEAILKADALEDGCS